MDIYLEQGGRTLRYHIIEISIVTPEESAVLAPTVATERHAGHLLPVLLCRFRAEAIHRARRA